MPGLNKAQRNIIRGMIDAGESGPAVRRAIDSMIYDGGSQKSSGTEGDYKKNVEFCRELAARGYPETAKHLEKKINR